MRASQNTQDAASVGDIIAGGKCLTFRPDQFVKIILAGMQNARTGCAGVVDEDGELIGMLTEREILRRIFVMVADPTINHANLGKHIDDMTVRDVMIVHPRTLVEDADIEDALALMTDLGFRFMPVVSKSAPSRLLGLADEREVAIHVRNRLMNVKRKAAEAEGMLHHLLREPYGFGVQ